MQLSITALHVGTSRDYPTPAITYFHGWGDVHDVPMIMFVIQGGTDGPIVVDTGTSDPASVLRFHSVVLEMVASPLTRIGITAQFDYADGQQPADMGGGALTVSGGGGAWNTVNWDDFYWSAAAEGLAHGRLDGRGRNISVLVGAQSDAFEDPHILQAYTIYASPRGMARWG